MSVILIPSTFTVPPLFGACAMFAVDALLGEPAAQLDERDHRALEPLVERDRLADVVAVAVGERDQVDALRLALALGHGRPREPGVDVDPLPARRIEPERCVAEPGEGSSHTGNLTEESASGPRKPRRMLRRLLPLGPVVLVALADGAGAHRLAFYLLLLAVPAAVAASLTCFGEALEGGPEEGLQALLAALALLLVVAGAAARGAVRHAGRPSHLCRRRLSSRFWWCSDCSSLAGLPALLTGLRSPVERGYPG